MYSAGDLIIYGGEGVCRVEQVGAPALSALDKDRTYYTLKPLYHSGIIYAPTDVNIRMRPVISKDEALSLIHGITDMATEFEKYDDAKQAAIEYKAALQTYDCLNLLQLIRLIYYKNVDAMAQKKGLGQTDDKYIKRAKELLYGELAVSLGIPVSEVEDMITKEVENTERTDI